VGGSVIVDDGTGLTLAVSSSTGVMSLAVGRVGGHTVDHLAADEIATERRHAEELSPRLAELLDRAGVALGDLDRLVIDVGPGRFTGLRVGLASVRALGFALQRPVIGLTSLAILGAGAEGASHDLVTAVIDARRNEVFQQCFDRGVPVAEAEVGDPGHLAHKARGIVVGDGADRYQDHYCSLPASNGVTVATGHNPGAAVMLDMSRGVTGKPGTEVEPLYLREPDAKANIKTRPGER